MCSLRHSHHLVLLQSTVSTADQCRIAVRVLEPDCKRELMATRLCGSVRLKRTSQYSAAMINLFCWQNVFLLTSVATQVGLPVSGLPQWLQRFGGKAWSLVISLSFLGVILLLFMIPGFAQALVLT